MGPIRYLAELTDFTGRIRRKLDDLLPGSHQSLLLALFALLLLLSTADSRDTQPAGPVPADRSIKAGLDLGPGLAPNPVPFAVRMKQPGEPDPAETNDDRLYLTVAQGDNLSLVFKRAGLGAADVHELTSGNEQTAVLTRLYPGDRLAFAIEDSKLNSLELFKSPLESYLFTRAPEAGFTFTPVTREPHRELVYKQAVINDSLFLAAQESRIPAGMALELAGIFNGVIDFILDTRKGDTFSVLYEEEYLNGEFVGNGRILAASFTNQGQVFKALRYENSAGESDFFNPEGESMRKAFLRNPVDFTRISDNFSLARKHPILNTIRAHRGTDYAAPKGTPVVATADGRVTFAARNGSFGKLVVIQHGNRFETKYAHLNDYARGIKQGTRVKQGQVIGYVGATGGATGPHLHYEFLMDGAHRDSRTIHDQLPKAESIPDSEMPRFLEQTRVLLSMLETQGASLQLAGKKAERQ